jgi:hypothetical protein
MVAPERYRAYSPDSEGINRQRRAWALRSETSTGRLRRRRRGGLYWREAVRPGWTFLHLWALRLDKSKSEMLQSTSRARYRSAPPGYCKMVTVRGFQCQRCGHARTMLGSVNESVNSHGPNTVMSLEGQV